MGRTKALDRIVAQAKSCHANAVVGIRTKIMVWHGTYEMLMTGTAARNSALSAAADSVPVTSDLTGEELWAMTALGSAPVKKTRRDIQRRTRRSASTIGGAAPDTIIGRAAADRAGARPYVRLRVRTNNGVEVPIGQNTGCP